jgi:hypothetical protein
MLKAGGVGFPYRAAGIKLNEVPYRARAPRFRACSAATCT